MNISYFSFGPDREPENAFIQMIARKKSFIAQYSILKKKGTLSKYYINQIDLMDIVFKKARSGDYAGMSKKCIM